MADQTGTRAAPRTDEELAAVVLDLAQESFIDHGFRGTKMEQLAKGAGISVGQLYHLFANKEALLLAVHDRAQTLLFEQYLEPAYAEAPPGGAIEHFVSIGRAYFRFYLENRQMGPLLLATTYDERYDPEIARVLENIRTKIAGGLGRMHEIVSEAIARGEIREVNPDAVIRWYWGALFGVLANNLRHPAAAIDDEELEQVIELGLASISALLRAPA
jgi:AcrR family transcriptional regulator